MRAVHKFFEFCSMLFNKCPINFFKFSRNLLLQLVMCFFYVVHGTSLWILSIFHVNKFSDSGLPVRYLFCRWLFCRLYWFLCSSLTLVVYSVNITVDTITVSVISIKIQQISSFCSHLVLRCNHFLYGISWFGC